MNDYDVIVIGGGATASTASVRWPKLACVSCS
jgi:pyruvate/2-oxoglutarate dehydrogenase complex dihydrolipoamide dehydrogenase (E3) component